MPQRGRRTSWLRCRLVLAKLAVGPVVLYSLLSLSGPLADGRLALAALLAVRILLGAVVLVLLWGRRQAPHLLAVGYLLLVLVTGLLDRSYDVLVVLVSGTTLLLTILGVAAGAWGRVQAGRTERSAS